MECSKFEGEWAGGYKHKAGRRSRERRGGRDRTLEEEERGCRVKEMDPVQPPRA